MLLVVRWLLCVVRCLWLVDDFSSIVVCCLLVVAVCYVLRIFFGVMCRLLFVARCLLLVVFGLLFVVW